MEAIAPTAATAANEMPWDQCISSLATDRRITSGEATNMPSAKRLPGNACIVRTPPFSGSHCEDNCLQNTQQEEADSRDRDVHRPVIDPPRAEVMN